MQIDITDQARNYLSRKMDFFLARKRVPRIVLAERSCHGANFRLFFESVHDDDQMVEAAGLRLYIPQELLAEFSGFSLTMEQFFLNRRLKITPIKQSYQCDCTAKCPNSAAAKADNKDK
ncbi:MAG: hypothetical protein LHW56_09630 [Candidatus Cloacimonetes bacterium]|nr:hypothetical protein [Candidatus Cloacimonadota bacterium]MDY0173152.1 hypothetical protein [Candidatus Cloacimonadaceae bacterium]